MTRTASGSLGLATTLGLSALVSTIGVRHALAILGFGAVAIGALAFVSWELYRHRDEIADALGWSDRT